MSACRSAGSGASNRKVRPVVGIRERQSIRMERPTRQRDRARRIHASDVAPFANQSVPLQVGLNTDLVLPPRLKPQLHVRRTSEGLDDAVVGDGLLHTLILDMRLPLQARGLVPDESIPPRARLRIGKSMHDSPVHAFRLASPELCLER